MMRIARKFEHKRKLEERNALREVRATKKKAHKEKKKAQKAEISKIMAEQNGTVEGKAVEDSAAKEGLDTGADFVELGVGKKKKVPGIGAVDRYPTNSEKRARKVQAMAIVEGTSVEQIQTRLKTQQAKEAALAKAKVDIYRAMKIGLSLDEYREKLANGEVLTPKVKKMDLPPEKLAAYSKRAAEKGITIEQYVKRRSEKYAVKTAEKLGYVNGEVGPPGPSFSGTAAEGPALGFVEDTTGDPSLAANNAHHHSASTTELAMPHDPKLWEGIIVKDLPKHIRDMRRENMAVKREAKKAAKGGSSATEKAKSRGQKKVEDREALVRQILQESRKAGGQGGTIMMDRLGSVPMVKVQSMQGKFEKREIGSARTVARRVMKHAKQADKAEKGRGRGKRRGGKG